MSSHGGAERLRLQKEALWSQGRITQRNIPRGRPTRRTRPGCPWRACPLPEADAVFGRAPHLKRCAPTPTAHLLEPSISVPPLPSWAADRWFSNLSVPQRHGRGLIKYWLPGPHLREYLIQNTWGSSQAGLLFRIIWGAF